MPEQTGTKEPKTTSKKRVESEFSRWLDEQLLHGEASALASEMGIAVSTVTYWRQGRNIPTPEHCQQIAQYLEADPEFVDYLVRDARVVRHQVTIGEEGQKQEAPGENVLAETGGAGL
jgi:transcriptional regulator with XRE-family HTH domain